MNKREMKRKRPKFKCRVCKEKFEMLHQARDHVLENHHEKIGKEKSSYDLIEVIECR